MATEPLTSTSSINADVRAKSLPKHLPVLTSTPPDLVPARMINEVLYCERLLYLEWAQGEFADNAFTVEGRTVHRRADQPGGKLPRPSEVVAPREGEPPTGAGLDEDRPYEVRT